MNIGQAINEYLKDKKDLITVDDSLNINGNTIIRWDFANIPCPTMEELEALSIIASDLANQARINEESLAYLASTDWYVIRQQETGSAIPQEILDQRAAARAAIIR